MISGLFTMAALLGFAGICWWAYTRHNRLRFEEAARLPLEDEGEQTPSGKSLPACCRKLQS